MLRDTRHVAYFPPEEALKRRSLLGDSKTLKRVRDGTRAVSRVAAVTRASVHLRPLDQQDDRSLVFCFCFFQGSKMTKASVKANATSCFVDMQSRIQMILNMKELYQDDPEKIDKTFQFDLCNVSAHCLLARHRLIKSIITSDDKSLQQLAKITYQDARCYIKEYRCVENFPEIANVLGSSGTVNANLRWWLLAVFSCLISVCHTV